jgi:glycosyltransferase involved in cell wall biosynthesis
MTKRERPLRILQVSTADVRGGAERVTWNLFTTYRARGQRSWLAVGEKRADDPDVIELPNDASRGTWTRFWHGVAGAARSASHGGPVLAAVARITGGMAEPRRRLDYHRGREDFDFPATQRLLELTPERPDIVHLHNLHGGYFDLRMLPWLCRQVPVIMTLHDAWLLSGHCAHSLACERWRTGCGRCPDLTLYPAARRDATAFNWRRKAEIFRRSSVNVATPSRWLMQRVEQSILAPAVADARIIANGVDLSTFRPGDRRRARAAFGLPPDAHVLLATAIDVQSNSWKDFAMLHDAVAALAREEDGQPLHVLVLGTTAPRERIGRATLDFVPYRDDAETVAEYYRAADVYVHPARADTFPTAVLEALATGTPVVASDVGGIREQVADGDCGFLVTPGDAPALTARLRDLLSDDALRRALGGAGRERAERHFDFTRQLDSYLDWYALLAHGAERRSAA